LDAKAKVEKYAGQSRHYLLNASKFIDAGNSEKASEFLWGSLAGALKAVALSKGIQLKKHGEIWDYVENLTKELEDKSIYDAFRHAHDLHINFYESDIELKGVRRMADDIRMAQDKLLRLIPGEG
jgi:uncharacterized protein (UPF0332 family)